MNCKDNDPSTIQKKMATYKWIDITNMQIDKHALTENPNLVST